MVPCFSCATNPWRYSDNTSTVRSCDSFLVWSMAKNEEKWASGESDEHHFLHQSVSSVRISSVSAVRSSSCWDVVPLARLRHHSSVSMSKTRRIVIKKGFVRRCAHTDADESIGGKALVWGISADKRGDIDWLFWSIWFELLFDGEKGDVIALGLVVDTLRWRDIIVDPLACELLILRVDGDGTKAVVVMHSDLSLSVCLRCIHGELICSLGVEGEVIEMEKFPSPAFFNAADFDAWGTISISFREEERSNECRKGVRTSDWTYIWRHFG